ncbi:hypothetical protein, partial [Salmonella sp. s58408]|uniref:hypothetical protein n=1 Tax=Salmonella sp. s58408 TaxID=3159701 RepID=UPI003980047C
HIFPTQHTLLPDTTLIASPRVAQQTGTGQEAQHCVIASASGRQQSRFSQYTAERTPSFDFYRSTNNSCTATTAEKRCPETIL